MDLPRNAPCSINACLSEVKLTVMGELGSAGSLMVLLLLWLLWLCGRLELGPCASAFSPSEDTARGAPARLRDRRTGGESESLSIIIGPRVEVPPLEPYRRGEKLSLRFAIPFYQLRRTRCWLEALLFPKSPLVSEIEDVVVI